MRKIWHESAWDEYVAWQREDAKTLKRINLLLQSIDRNGTGCIGNPEPLRGNLSGWWTISAPTDVKVQFVSTLPAGPFRRVAKSTDEFMLLQTTSLKGFMAFIPQ